MFACTIFATKLTRFAARHGFQYVLVNPSPGVRFSGELDALTAHWTTANVEETATIEFGGDGAEMLASIRDIARASQISNVAAYLPVRAAAPAAVIAATECCA